MSVNRFENIVAMVRIRPEEPAGAKLDDRSVAVILDISPDWRGPDAASAAQAALGDRGAGPVLLRIALPGDDDAAQEALVRLAALRPDGFVLSGCSGGADIQRLDVMLRVAEAQVGIEDGSIAILAEVGREPGFFLSDAPLAGISARLKGLIFDGAALLDATASRAMNEAAARPGAPMIVARSVTVLKASQAGLRCWEQLPDGSLSADTLRILRETALADGFSGLVARDRTQLQALFCP